MSTIAFPAGGYAFVPGVFQYSAGVRALPGHRIERVRFAHPVPLMDGFQRISAHLHAIGRPLAAFCACELRSPAPFMEDGFRAFNEAYATVLRMWGLLATGHNPVARSNVCPAVAPPPEPSFHAFCYARPLADAPASFVVAGSGEVPEGKDNYRDHIVALGDVSPTGMRAKVRYVVSEMERRLAALGTSWAAVTATQVYTVQDFHPFIAEELLARGAGPHGLTWHFDRPPVVGLDYEMDCRGIHIESVLPD